MVWISTLRKNEMTATSTCQNLTEKLDLEKINQFLKTLTAQERVAYSLEYFPSNFALSSSFGAQSAVSLHLLTQEYADIPVLVADTGYLFPETYQFIDSLKEKLNLNLKVFRSKYSPAWQEARYGKAWKEDQSAMDDYNQRNKVEPIQRGLDKLDVQTWFAGVRSSQSDLRGTLPIVQEFKGRYKIHPILDWSDKDIYDYLKKHNLPYHPLWEKGYLSIGDVHSTRSVHDASNEDELRFNGFNRECGLHVE